MSTSSFDGATGRPSLASMNSQSDPVESAIGARVRMLNWNPRSRTKAMPAFISSRCAALGGGSSWASHSSTTGGGEAAK